MARYPNGNNTEKWADDIDKILAVVVRRRKVIPDKCIEFHKRMTDAELQSLENATIICKNNSARENYRRIIQEAKQLRHVPFSNDDLYRTEKRFLNCQKRTQQITDYLDKMKIQKLENSNP